MRVSSSLFRFSPHPFAFILDSPPQPARPPSFRPPPRRARTASMSAAAPVKRGDPPSRIRAPTRHGRASPHPSRKCRLRGRKPLTRRRIDAAKCMRLCQPHPRFRHAGVRCASALRGVAGAATHRFTRSCYTFFQARRLPHSLRQPPRPLAQGEATPVRFFATGCRTRRLSATRLNDRCGLPAHACHTENGGCRPLESLLRACPAPPIRQHPERLPLGESVRQRKANHPQSVFPQPLAKRDGLARPA